jgi:hypothetical protein
VEKIKKDYALLEMSEFLPSTRFRIFDVFVNFVSVIMRSNTITSQTLFFFPKNGWIILPWGNSVDVKQLDVPSRLGFMMKSIPTHNTKLFMETLCFENCDNFKNILGFPRDVSSGWIVVGEEMGGLGKGCGQGK